MMKRKNEEEKKRRMWEGGSHRGFSWCVEYIFHRSHHRWWALANNGRLLLFLLHHLLLSFLYKHFFLSFFPNLFVNPFLWFRPRESLSPAATCGWNKRHPIGKGGIERKREREKSSSHARRSSCITENVAVTKEERKKEEEEEKTERNPLTLRSGLWWRDLWLVTSSSSGIRQHRRISYQKPRFAD